MVAPQTKTVALDADLVDRAQREADKRGIALKQLVDDALERKLTGEGTHGRARWPRLGLGHSTDGLSAAKTANEPVRPPDPSDTV